MASRAVMVQQNHGPFKVAIARVESAEGHLAIVLVKSLYRELLEVVEDIY